MLNIIAHIKFPALIIAGFFIVSTPAFAATSSCTPFTAEYVSSTAIKVQNVGSAVPTYKSTLWTPEFPGATWIWSSPTVQKPQNGAVRVFVLNFTLPASVSSSVLKIAADDYFSFTINGTLVDSQFGYGNFLPKNIHIYKTPSLFHRGANIITFTVVNAPYFYVNKGTAINNPAGLMFRLELQGTSCITNATRPTNNSKDRNGAISIPIPIIVHNNAHNKTTIPAPQLNTINIVTHYTFHAIQRNIARQTAVTPNVPTEIVVSTSTNKRAETVTAKDNSLFLASVIGAIAPFQITCILNGFVLAIILTLIWQLISFAIYSKMKPAQKTMLQIEMSFYLIVTLLAWPIFKTIFDQCDLIAFLVLILFFISIRVGQNMYFTNKK